MRDTIRFFLPDAGGIIELPIKLVAMSVYNDLPLAVQFQTGEGKVLRVPGCFSDGSGVEITVRRTSPDPTCRTPK